MPTMDRSHPYPPSLRGAILAMLCGVAGVVLLVGGLAWAFEAHYRNRIFPGVDVMGVPLGGLTTLEARQRLEGSLEPSRLPYVSLSAADDEWLLSTSALGGRLALDEAARAARAVGRSGIFRRDVLARLRALWYGYTVVPPLEVEPGAALAALRQVARQVGQPAQNAQLWVAGLQARTGPSEAGHDLDIAATRERIRAAVYARLGESRWYGVSRLARLWRNEPLVPPTYAEPVPVALAFREIAPQLTEVAGAADDVTRILHTPITLTAELPENAADGTLRTEQRTWAIDQATLSTWLALEQRSDEEGAPLAVTVDRERIAAYVEAFAAALGRPPREARFDYDPGAQLLTALAPGQYGWTPDVAEATERIAAACTSREERRVELPVRTIAPRVTRQDLEALMPLSLISVGETSFVGSTPDRLQNIRAATARFHGLLVPGGATFSFLDHLGPVTVANGYSQAWIILGQRTVLGPGGGVCQVSTTCFRAAFYGGYPFEERWAHAYRVSWYEPPLGLDAAVYSPGTDMKFRNDTDMPILIITEIDEVAAKLYFRFYGAPRAREVSLEGPIATRSVPAGPAIVTPDASLPPGVRVLDESAHDGIDVTVTRVISANGQTTREEIISQYAPWPARYRVGPAQ